MERLSGYVHKRLESWPLWQLVGKVDFFGLTFSINEKVLIPRPETEILVEIAVDILGRSKTGALKYVADIGTGSGNIAVSIAKSRSDVYVYAVDISTAAVEMARANAAANGAEGSISFLVGDLLGPFENAGRNRLDMIVSNPPYVSAFEWERLLPEVRHREPREALYGGDDGLIIIKKLIAKSPTYLKRSGYLIMEVGRGQAGRVMEIMDSSGFFREIRCSKDYTGVDRVVVARNKAQD
jgi:release factor glutamine methyltransferase